MGLSEVFLPRPSNNSRPLRPLRYQSPTARQQHARSPSTIPGPAEPYTGRRRKRSRFFKSFPSLLQVPPPRNRHTCHLQDKPLDPRQTHLPEEFACWFWSGRENAFTHVQPSWISAGQCGTRVNVPIPTKNLSFPTQATLVGLRLPAREYPASTVERKPSFGP
ncbi:hypothetical protein WA026_005352 [Henosepilachna vigintioctopunctata]|uniref:Uncharacterized protein n=1 Tax=Henosepilachna vigintioctopunctata TaxID=420089 RepID=A0AAW1TW44_9CUCU